MQRAHFSYGTYLLTLSSINSFTVFLCYAMSGDITALPFYITTCSLFRLFGSAVSFLQCCSCLWTIFRNHFTTSVDHERFGTGKQCFIDTLQRHGAGPLYNITCVCNRATRFRGDILLCGRAAHFPARGVNALPAQLVTVPHDITSPTLWRASSLLLTHGSSPRLSTVRHIDETGEKYRGTLWFC